MSFQQNKYQVIKKAISYELANFVFNYFLLKREAVNYMYSNNIIAENSLFGTWKDQQVPNVYSHYADFAMETLLMKVMPIMQKETGLNLSDQCVDLENVSFKAHCNACGWTAEEDAELVFVACNRAGMIAEEAGLNINKLLGFTIY